MQRQAFRKVPFLQRCQRAQNFILMALDAAVLFGAPRLLQRGQSIFFAARGSAISRGRL